MKSPKNYRISLGILWLSILSFFLTSCNRLKDPLYVGTWQHEDKIDIGGLILSTTRTLILTETTYEEIYIIKRENSDFILSILGIKGDLLVNGPAVAFSLKEIGTCVKDASQNCTDQVVFYGPGTQYYADNIQYFTLTINGNFEADENFLRLSRDLNADGDTDDIGEYIEFERG